MLKYNKGHIYCHAAPLPSPKFLDHKHENIIKQNYFTDKIM
jgi:hypothetical protein